MKTFLKEDFLPVAFILGFLLTSGFVLGKYLYPVQPNAALTIGIFVILLTIVMFVAYMAHMDKRNKRKQPPNVYEIEKVLILSTGHLSKHEFETMQDDDEIPIRVIKHEYGALLILYGFDTSDEFNECKNYMLGHFPKLWRVLMFAKGMGCRYVNFDQDGSCYSKLPVYSW